MSEITATEKKQQPEKWAMENWATGKLSNKKRAGRKKEQHKVIVREEGQRYFRLQKKNGNRKNEQQKMGNGPKRRGNGDRAMIDMPWQHCPSPVWDKSTLIFRNTTNFLVREVEITSKCSLIRPTVLTELRRDTHRYTDDKAKY